MYNQVDPDDSGPFTPRVSLRDDPEPALQSERQAASDESRAAAFVRMFGPIALIVVLVMLYGAYRDYITHSREIPPLVTRGQRISGEVSNTSRVGGRYRYTPDWRVEYTYIVDGQKYAGRAYMGTRPEAVTVVFDPLNPAAHRAEGAMELSNVDGRHLIMLGAVAVVLAFIVLVSWWR